MTLAATLVAQWYDRPHTRTISVGNLAREIDPEVKSERYEKPLSFVYTFSDGSVARTQGLGIAFKMWESTGD